MDYGSVVYSSARCSVLKPLNSIHLTGIRYATGAFRTSPLLSVCCESGIPPLHHRRNRCLLSYVANIWTQPSHPNFKVLFSSNEQRIYEDRLTITAPACVRFQRFLAEQDLQFPKIYPFGFCEIPPWLIPLSQIRLDLNNLRKTDTSASTYQQRFNELISEYPNSKIIFTDGSKIDSGVGSAISINGETYSWSLPLCANILTSELYAVWQALRYIDLDQPPQTFLICCDSLKALKLLQNPFGDDAATQLISSTVFISS